MKNAIYWIIGILVVGGITWYAVAQNSSSTTVSSTNATSTTAADTSSTVGGDQVSATDTTSIQSRTVDALLAVAAPQTCTFSDNTNGNTVSGTIYTANNKLRGDFTTNINGKISYTHAIMDPTYTYTWIDGQTTGVKVVRAAGSSMISSDIDLNNIDNFSCTTGGAATADFTKFNLPTTIKFAFE